MAKKKRRYKKSKKSISNSDIAVPVLIVLSILLAVLIYTKSGIVGLKLNEILGGMMGFMQYILPIGIFTVAIKIASDNNEDLISKLIQYGIVIISLSIVLSVFQISAGELQTNKELSEVVKDAYYLGMRSSGGGAIGAVGAFPLTKLLGNVGAIILCIGVATIFIAFTLGISLSDIITLIMEKIQDRKEQKMEQREMRLKEREEQIEDYKEKRKRATGKSN